MTRDQDLWAQALVGLDLDGYRVGSEEGRGHFSLVFAVDQPPGERPLAIKVLPPVAGRADIADFEYEGKLLSRLSGCSGVIELVASGTGSIGMQAGSAAPVIPVGFQYHVMELATADLEELVEDPAILSRISWKERISIWRGLVLGVHQMHLKGVAHRDLKSSNCLLVVRGSRTEVRIADLGRAKDLRLPDRYAVEDYAKGRGDLRFAPPEYIWMQGKNDARACRLADVYGLGSLLFELGTGHSMTSAAIESVRDARLEGIKDLANGRTRNLATLRPQFRLALSELEEQLPAAIRHEAVELVGQLCDPVASCRPPQFGPGGPRSLDPGLNWLIRRADILAGRLDSPKSRHTYRKHKSLVRSA